MLVEMINQILFWIKNNKILFIIFVIAILLRVPAIKPGFHPYHNDEGADFSRAIYMIMNTTIDPGKYFYPGMLPTLNMVLFVIIFVPLYLCCYFLFRQSIQPINYKGIVDLWQFVVNTNEQTQVMFWARYITVIFGLGAVFLVYKLALKLFKNRNIGIVASLLTAVNYRQVLNSHLSLPDICNSFFVLLSLFLFIKYQKNKVLKIIFMLA